MKTVKVEFIWRTVEDLEVSDDWEVPSNLADFPDGVLEQVTADAAELYDWRAS